MTSRTNLAYHVHRAQLAEMGQHWQRLLAYGHGPWRGDRNLTLYHNVLQDNIEVWHELPDEQPTIIMSVPVDQFDINKLCHALWKADNLTSSPEEKALEVDARNAMILAERDKAAAELAAAAEEKLRWAINKDLNHAPGPVTVPKDLK